MRRKNRKIGLVLGSGGARGWSHVGVIDAIRELGIPIHCVTGTSMGALVGAAFASGKIEALRQAALDVDWKQVIYRFLEVSLPRSGLIDGGRVVDFLKEHIAPVDITQLPMPFACVAADVMSGQAVVFRDGSVIDAVRASISIPGVFTPFVKDGRLLVDGGLVDPLPIGLARELGANYVIAVDITRDPVSGSMAERTQAAAVDREPDSGPEWARNLKRRVQTRIDAIELPRWATAKRWFSKSDQPNLFDILGNSMRVIQHQITAMRLQLEPPDLLIQPDVQDISTMEFQKSRQAVHAGYEAGMRELEKGSMG